MKYAIEQRLRFIDFLLHQYGEINRSAIMDYFGVSLPQAACDIAEYKKVAPDNITYDASAKKYLRTKRFERVWQ